MNGNAIIVDDDGCNVVETIATEIDTGSKGASKAGHSIDPGDQVTTSNSNNNVIEIDDSQEPDKTPANVEALSYNQIFKANKYLAQFVEKCLTLENSPGMLRIMNRTLFTMFVEADPEYKMSPKFDRLLVKMIKRLECDPTHKFSHIKSLCDILRLHKLKRRVHLITIATNLKDNNCREQIKSGNGVKRPSNSDRVEKKQKADIIDLDNEQETVINLEEEHVENDVILLEDKDENSNKESNALPHNGDTLIDNRLVTDEPTLHCNEVNNANAIKESLPVHTDKTITDSNFNRNLISETITSSSSHYTDSQLRSLEVKDPNKESLPDPIDKKKIILNFNRNVISGSNSNLNPEHTMYYELVPVESDMPIAIKKTLPGLTEKGMTNLNFKKKVMASNSNPQYIIPQLSSSSPNATNSFDKIPVSNVNMDLTLKSIGNLNSQHIDRRLKQLESLPKNCNTIEYIEKEIAYYKKVITYLDNQEVNVDSYNSPYVKSERYRQIVVELYKMLCDLTGKQAVKRRQVTIHAPPGSPPGPAKKLEQFLNENIGEDGEVPFPDFVDVLKCVTYANRVDKLGWSCLRVMNEAHSLFAKCGNALKKQRQNREWRDLMSHVKQEMRDPADDDPELLAKLELNKRVAKQKENDVIERFLSMENMGTHNSCIDLKVTRESDTSDDEESVACEDLQNITDAISSDNSTAGEVIDISNEEKVTCKQEPEDISALLAQLGDNYTATIVDIEDPFVTVDIDSDSDDEISNRSIGRS